MFSDVKVKLIPYHTVGFKAGTSPAADFSTMLFQNRR